LLFTGLLVVVGYLQYQILQKTDETNRIGLRPYISAVKLDIDTETWPLYWKFRVVAENSGGTPPIDMRYLVHASTALPIDPEEIYKKPGELDTIFYGTIAPKTTTQLLPGETGVPSSFFDTKRYWYISGVIHYRDRFKGTQERISKFCFAAISVKDYKTGRIRAGYDTCRFWNCIDKDDCKADNDRYSRELKALNQ
jgi:hypothetical protein